MTEINTEINLTKIFKEWYRDNPDVGSLNRDISDDDINLGLVKLEAKNVTWKPMSSGSSGGIESREITRQATITQTGQASTGAGAFGQVHSSKETETGITVKIGSGVIKGSNRYLKLSLDTRVPVPGHPVQELKENFGDCLEVDPSKYQSHVKQNNVKLDMAMEQALGPKGATAVIKYKAKEYKATFRCTLVLKGKVPVRVGGGILQQEISQILSDVKKKFNGVGPSPNDDLAALTINGDKAELTMTGEAEFRWESDHSVTWQNK